MLSLLSLQLNLTTTTNSNEPWRIPSCRLAKAHPIEVGGLKAKCMNYHWWCAVISIISDDGFTLSQIIFLSSSVNQYLLQISVKLSRRFSSFIPHHSKHKMRMNIYRFEKFSTKKVCLFSLRV